jgi:hypothetical protein
MAWIEFWQKHGGSRKPINLKRFLGGRSHEKQEGAGGEGECAPCDGGDAASRRSGGGGGRRGGKLVVHCGGNGGGRIGMK